MSTSRCTLLVCALAALSTVVGCSPNRWRQEILETEGRAFLYREYQLTPDSDTDRVALGHAHPLTIEARDVESLFSHLVILKTSWLANSREMTIFTQQQAETLAAPVAKALSTLKPNERLRFLVPDQSLANMFYGSTGTTGVIFCSGPDQIDIAFDSVHEGINDGDGGRPEEVLFAENPTEITGGDVLIPFEGSRRYIDKASSQDYPRWLTVDRARLSTLPEIAAVRTEATPPAGTGNTVASNPPKVETTPPKPDTIPPKVETTPPKTETTPPKVETTPPKDPKLEAIREKIRRLKNLRDNGDITAEEYEKQFDELMKDL